MEHGFSSRGLDVFALWPDAWCFSRSRYILRWLVCVAAATETQRLPADYVERVRTMHETGGEGSIGWRYNWSLGEAKKNLLRTHTTAVSSRMLYALAQQKEFTPKKYFSIDRVFRNESIDATHLAEV